MPSDADVMKSAPNFLRGLARFRKFVPGDVQILRAIADGIERQQQEAELMEGYKANAALAAKIAKEMFEVAALSLNGIIYADDSQVGLIECDDQDARAAKQVKEHLKKSANKIANLAAPAEGQ